MKLTRLEIDNFAGIGHADIDLSAPVNIFLGENSTGKSSVRDAIELVMTGGFCESRGYTKKNQAPRMTHRGGGKLEIDLHTSTGVFNRHETGNGSAGNTPAINSELARIAVNPQSVLTMKPEDRAQVFLQVVGAGLDTNVDRRIIEELNKAGFKSKRAGDENDEIASNCVDDMDATQKWAVEQRIAAKRALKSLEAVTGEQAPPAMIQVGDRGKLNLGTVKIDTYQAAIKQREIDRDTVIKQLGAAQGELDQKEGAKLTQDDVDRFSQAKRDTQKILKGLDIKKAEKVKESAHNSVVQAEKIANAKGAVIEDLDRQRAAVKDALDDVATLKGTCPTCSQKITKESQQVTVDALTTKKNKLYDACMAAKKEHVAILKTLDQRRKDYQTALDSCQQVIEKQNSYQMQIEAIDKTFSDITRRVELDTIIEKLTKDQTDLEGRVVAIQTVITAYDIYTAYLSQQEVVRQQVEEQQTVIKQMDKLDALLKPDGAVRQIANEQIESISFDTELQQAWNMEALKIEADGSITFNGDPIEAACDTERYRAGVLLAELLSRSLGLGFLILDGVDILKKPLKEALFARLSNWGVEFDSILIFSAVDSKPEVTSSDKVSYHWVENGTVVPIGQMVGAI